MTPTDILNRHIHAFNARDIDALMALFAPTAEWITGQSRIVGKHELREFFAGAFAELLPTLEVRTVLEAPDRVACEIAERLTHDGATRVFNIAGFYTISDGRIVAAKIYREGSAELD